MRRTDDLCHWSISRIFLSRAGLLRDNGNLVDVTAKTGIVKSKKELFDKCCQLVVVSRPLLGAINRMGTFACICFDGFKHLIFEKRGQKTSN